MEHEEVFVEQRRRERSSTGFDEIMSAADDYEHHGGMNKEVLSTDDALKQVGTGRFQWFALHVCGLANAADAVEILSISLVLPAAEDDLGLTASGRAALTTSIFVGMMVGGAVWGLFGDCMGRRVPLIAALLLSSVFGAASSMASSVGSLVFLRTIAGIGVGGTVPTAFTYMAEVVEPSNRGRFMVLLAAHWMMGSITSAVLGWILIPTLGWRVFLLAVSLPAAAGAVEALWLPESPRFFQSQGKGSEALLVLRRIAQWNKSLWAPDAVHTELRHDDRAAPGAQHQQSGGSTMSRIEAQGKEVLRHLVGLVRPEHRINTLALGVAWLGLSGGWYGLLLWFPEYSKRRGAEPVQIYAEMLLVALSNLPGNIASFFLVDRIGRRKTLAVSMASGAFFVAFFAFLPTNGTRATTILGTVSIMVFNGVSVGGWNALDLITPELYPTALRCTAMGILGLIGRVGSILGNAQAAWLVEKVAWAPLVVSSAFLVAGTVAVLSLPETAGRALDEAAGDSSSDSRRVSRSSQGLEVSDEAATGVVEGPERGLGGLGGAGHRAVHHHRRTEEEDDLGGHRQNEDQQRLLLRGQGSES